MDRMSVVPVTWGPLARDVDSLVLAMRALWDGKMHALDPLSPSLTFQNEVRKLCLISFEKIFFFTSILLMLLCQMYEGKGKLKIGYFYDNGFIAPTPACRRAVDMALQELRKYQDLFEVGGFCIYI